MVSLTISCIEGSEGTIHIDGCKAFQAEERVNGNLEGRIISASLSSSKKADIAGVKRGAGVKGERRERDRIREKC